MTAPRSFRGAARALLVVGVAASCHRDPPPRIRLAAIERCEDGILSAVKEPELADTMRIYREECASLYVEPGCHDAFLSAATASLDEQTPIVFTACQRAYCPILSGNHLEACGKDFVPTRDAIERAWPPLHEAIFAHDTGGYAWRVTQAVLVLEANVRPRRTAEGAASAP